MPSFARSPRPFRPSHRALTASAAATATVAGLLSPQAAQAQVFDPPLTNPFGLQDVGGRSSPTFADLDGDGDLDAFVGNSSGNTLFFENTSTPLPVELTTFTATIHDHTVDLAWTTESETHNAGFELHRLLDENGTFTLLAFIPGAGTTNQPQHYRFTTPALAPGTHRFRLNQLDFDGGFEYSPVVEVTLELAGSHHLSPAYPNPFRHRTRFAL